MRVPYATENVHVAQRFFVDCDDLLERYDRTIEFFFACNSRRLKCFSDLRGAYECILKAIVAYHQPPATDREALIRTAEKFGHRIGDLETAVSKLVDHATYSIAPIGHELDRLPVALRYSLDGRDFLEVHNTLYYQTIGSDPWLAKLHSYIEVVFKAMNQTLSKHSGIISISDIPIEKLLGNDYNKYRKA